MLIRSLFRLSLAVLFCCSLLHDPASAQVAPGVQQSAGQTGTITGNVVGSTGAPVVGATIKLTGPSTELEAVSDTHGTFVFTSVPYGIYHLEATAANVGVASRDHIVVSGDITVTIQYSAQGVGTMKTIAHVSTTSSGAQINVAPASIASISPSDYAFAGNVSWQHLLERIPGVSVSGSLRGGASCTVAVPGNPMQPVVLSINGALPYETSVTMDGMPLYNTSPGNDLFFGSVPGAGTNVSFLPLPALDTADVVRGPGANAPSIVDSIGGSFVLHAPNRIEHNQFELSTSTDPYGGFSTNMRAAVRFGKLSAMVVYGVNDSPGPFDGGNYIPATSIGILSINGNPVTGNSGQLSYAVPNSKFPGCAYGLSDCGLQDNLLYCCVTRSSSWSAHTGSVGLSYDLSPTISAQIFYAGSSSQESNYPSPWYQTWFTPTAGYSGSIQPGKVYDFPSNIEVGPITDAESMLEEKITANVGRGVLRLAALQNNSFYNVSFPYELEPNGTYTAYGTAYYQSAPTTPVIFNGVPAQFTFCPFSASLTYWTNNRDLLGSYATQIGTASSAGISFVTAYVNAPSHIDEVFSGFPFVYNQSPAVNETTDEVRLNGGTQFSDNFTVDASWYFAQGHYHVQNPNDPTQHTYVDSSFPYSAPRLSATWRLNTDEVVRAAAGGGYALPPINYLVGPYTFSPNTPPICTGGSCSESLTNLNLQPEKSFGWDVGTDIRLHRETVLSVDLYHTDLYGQFFQSSAFAGTCPTCGGLPLYITQYDNISHSRFEGINFDIRHDTVAQGIFWQGSLGLTRGYVVSVPKNFYNGVTSLPPSYTSVACTNCINTYIVPGINFDGADQATIPYATATAEFGYRWSPAKYVEISPTYYGPNNAYLEPAFVEVDGQAGYPLTKNISLIALFRNITGIYGQAYQTNTPTFEVPLEGNAAPYTAAFPNPLLGIPYGPRTIVLTLNFKY